MRALLADPHYRADARRLHHVFGRVDGPGAVADAIHGCSASPRARRAAAIEI